ncbi:MAG TPA: MucBP domain-containing protein, partial [Verrucomicrobiae bacterium]
MRSRIGSSLCYRLIVLWLSSFLLAWQSWCNAQSVNLTWSASASPNVVGYNIFYGTVSGTYPNEISTGNVTNLTVSGLAYGGTYYFAAAAVNSSGIQSALSGQIAYTVPLSVPSLSITNVTTGMHVNSSAFTAMGVATDSVTVANVYYSLNGSAYNTAGLSGTQWTASLMLASGTNTLSAYAVDVNNSRSGTDTVTIVYAPMAVLTVQTNGEGVINPNYNGSSLQVGTVYSMTATPINGFKFSNWTGLTNGTFTTYTNGQTVQFTMFSNLVMQANFVDTNKPFVSITNLTPGIHVGNGTFTAMGITTDNVAVASVQYSFDGGAFVPATITGNGWSSVPLSLNPGSNSLAVYATDTSGNVSATTTVIFDYVVSAALTVQTNGDGIISPNYNGSLLQIATGYSMTATPINGFAFSNWTGSTNGTFTTYTNGQTVQFTMVSNLVMQANFVDTNKPFVSITNLTPGVHVGNGTFTAMGITTDNVAVASVQYSFDGGAFAPATITGNGWSSVPLSLNPGSNSVAVYATDTSGNVSATTTVIFDYVVSAALTVQTNGDGIISPNYNGSLLQIATGYSMTATPINGFAFSNWTGSTNGTFTTYTNGQTVQFTMFSNLVMQANFVDTNKPFVSITNLTPGIHVGNGTFTAMGITTDNVAVASVQYSFDGGAFVPATITGNSWSSVPLSLNPGSNSLAVYATDTSGNVSATTTVNFDYVVSAALTVQTNGDGIISPNYNGSLLQIATVYSMTATPINGFAFSNWTGSTNGTFTTYTNGQTVQFTMFSNLVMQANFVDTNKPFVSITNITSGMQTGNVAFTAMGITTDNVAVASVQYSFDGGAFVPATITGNSWSSVPLSLNPGSNSLAVYATDTSGNVSATTTVNFD